MVRGKAEKDEGDGAWEAVRQRVKRVKVEAKKGEKTERGGKKNR